MSDWKRTTQEISIENLPSEIVFAINQHFDQYNLGPILSDTLMCVPTDSQKVKKGLFGGAEMVRISAVVTPRWLIWAVNGTKTEPTVLSAQLVNLSTQDYAQTPFVKMVPDSGIEVSGLFTDRSEGSSAFIGLDEGVPGKSFER
jgi:hypothetical protein